MMFLTACQTYPKASNASVCVIPFDYGDTGANATNKRALLLHYCLCKDERACK